MAAPVKVREDLSSEEVRACARSGQDLDQVCRLLAIAAILERGSRAISATRSGCTGAFPGGRDLSRRRPSTLSCTKRSRQRHPQVFDLPVAAMMAKVLMTLLLVSTTRARQMAFCGLIGSAMIDPNCRRSASNRLKDVPLPILPHSYVRKPMRIPKRTHLIQSIYWRWARACCCSARRCLSWSPALVTS